jgi:argininosuccinate synthase
VNLVEAFLQTNAIGGRNGIGIGTHLVENRFVGIKSRGVYESPGVELLGTCYAFLLQLILDRRAREFFDQLSLLIAKQIYQGYWFDLATQMALQAIQPTAELATGTITVSLYKGHISFVSATNTPHSLYSEENASMEGIGSYNHADSEGLLRVFGVSARVLATSGQIKG